ncbi:MAG TPA: SHOCT domain-containing protein [Candidatus Paceibacterota bacterium]
MYYGDCYSWPFHALGGLIQAFLWVIFIMIVLRIIKGSRRGTFPSWRSWRGDGAEDLLKERFVKGEISREEYEEKMRVIRNDGRTSDASQEKKG